MPFWDRFAQLPLKRFYKYLLKRLIGGFLLREIDLEQLDVQLYKGIVGLYALELNVEQFNGMLCGAGLLMHFVSGMIGCIKMDVPWCHLLKDPCKIYMSGLHLVLCAGLTGSAHSAVHGTSGGHQGGDPFGRGAQNAAAPASRDRPRYSQDGIETLSRLAKLVLSRMEICLEDASVALVAPPAGSALRARLASVVAFAGHEDDVREAAADDDDAEANADDDGEQGASSSASENSDPGIVRAVRFSGFEVLLEAQDTVETRRTWLCAASERLVSGGAQSPAASDAADCAVLASTCMPPGTPQDWVYVRRRRTGCEGDGMRLDVLVAVHALRFALGPAPLQRLSELLACMGEARLRALAEREGSSESNTPSTPSVGMVQSFMEQSLHGGNSTTGFWQAFYNLYESDALLEQASSPAADQEEPADFYDEQEQAIMMAEGADLVDERDVAVQEAPLLAVSVRAAISHVTAVVVLEPHGHFVHRRASAVSPPPDPRPADVAVVPGRPSRMRQDHLQLSIEGWQMSATRSMATGADAAASPPPRLSFRAGSLTAHVHQWQGAGLSPRGSDRMEASAAQSGTALAASKASAFDLVVDVSLGTPAAVAALPTPRQREPEEFLIFSRREEGDLAQSSASLSLNAVTLANLTGTGMFRSACSNGAAELRAVARTPSLSSCHCSTNESIGVHDDDEGGSSLHSAASSVRSLDAESPRHSGQRQQQRNTTGDGTDSGMLFESVAAAASRSFAPPFRRPQLDEDVLDDDGLTPFGADEDQVLPWSVMAGQMKDLFFDRTRSVSAALSGDATAEGPGATAAGVRDPPCAATERWTAASPSFRSKCILRLASCSEAAVQEETLAARWQPSLPPREHPLWGCLRSFAGGSSALPEALGAAVFVEWRDDPAVAAAADPPPSLHVELQPIVITFCTESLDLLCSGTSWFADDDDRPQSAAPPAAGVAAAPPATDCLGSPAGQRSPRPGPPPCFRAVCLVPLLYIEMALRRGTAGEEDLVVGTLAAPRVFLLPRELGFVPTEDEDVFSEVLRFEADDLAVELRPRGSAASTDRPQPLRVISLDSKTEASCQIAVSIFRDASGSSGQEAASFGHDEAEALETPLASEPMPEKGVDLWTKISEVDSGRASKSAMVLQDLRSASKRLLWQGGGRRPGSDVASDVAASRHRSPSEERQLPGAARSRREPLLRQTSAPLAGKLRSEVVVAVPGSLVVQVNASSLSRLQDAVSTFSESWAECPLAAPRAEVAAFACTIELGCARLSMLGIPAIPDFENDDDKPGVETVSACTEQLNLRLEPIQCRLVQTSGGALFLRGLCRSFCVEMMGDAGDPPEQLVRPWFRPIHDTLVKAATAHSSRPRRAPAGSSRASWLARRVLRKPCLVPHDLLDSEGDRWRSRHCFLLEAERMTGLPEVTVSLSRLSCQSNPQRLARLQRQLLAVAAAAACGPSAAASEKPVGSPAASSGPGIVVRVALLDTVLDLASDGCAKDWPNSAPMDGNASAFRPAARGSDADKWRMAVHLDGLEVCYDPDVAFDADTAWASLRECNIFLVDHPFHLAQLDLLTDVERPASFLRAIGFAHILHLGIISTVWQDGPGARLSPMAAVARQVLEISVAAVSGHICADTVRCLLAACMELLEVIGSGAAQDASGAPATAQQRGTGQSVAQPAEAGQDAEVLGLGPGLPLFRTSSTLSCSSRCGDFLQGIDMFAFDASSQDSPGDAPSMRRYASPPGVRSCLVDDYIHNQELLRSPRLPIQAQPDHFDESGAPVEMELMELDGPLEEPAGTSGAAAGAADDEGYAAGHAGSVAVCLFDPDAYPQEKLRLLMDEDDTARAEVERHCAHRLSRTGSSSAVSAQSSGGIKHQDGSAAVCYIDLAALQVVSDHFAGSESPKPSAPPLPAPAVARAALGGSRLVLRCEAAAIALCNGDDFVPIDAAQAQASLQIAVGPEGVSSASSASRPSGRRTTAHLVLQLRRLDVRVTLYDTTPLRRRLTLRADDFGIVDHVQSSAFSHVLSYFADEQRRPRPSDTPMLRLRIDEVLPSGLDSVTPLSADSPEYQVELGVLPLRLTVDQDVVDFLLNFVQLCTLPGYVEEPQELLSASAMESPEVAAGASTSPVGRRGEPTSAPTQESALFFQHFSISPLLLSVDYRAKRLDVEALRRGELWELINLLPLLEGLQIAFRAVAVNGAAGLSQVATQVVDAWSADLNRTQILRSLTGVTPIRSFATIGGGFVDMVLEPLKLYRSGSGSQRVSRTLFRGLVSFLRNVTVESIDLTERVLVGAQSSLEFVADVFGEGQAPAAVHAGRAAPAAPPAAASAAEARAEAELWTPVERGAADFLQPAGAADGLQQAYTSLSREVRHAGEAVVVRPLMELQRGVPREKVLKSVVSGIPLCVLRPAIGATAAATTALRGVRNSVDPRHKREVEEKFKGPE